MNIVKLTFFAFFIVGFSACNKEDDTPATCTQSDWVGVFEGDIDCDGDKGIVLLTITPSGSNSIYITYTTAGATTTYTSPLTLDNCSVKASGTDAGLTISVDATLSGKKLTLKETITGSGQTYTCNLSMTKK